MKERNWKNVRLSILGVFVTDQIYNPFYSGTNFEKACEVAEQRKSCVWESPTRDYWMVSDKQPPYALAKPEAPRDRSWTLVGGAQ